MIQETKRKQKKVLVIDDDVLLVRLIEHNLSQIEVTVLKAYTGYDGLSMARDQQPDLVILDIVLPDIDGWEVLAAMKEINPDVKVLLFSGQSLGKDTGEILAGGALGFIKKPVKKAELLDKIAKALNKKKRLRDCLSRDVDLSLFVARKRAPSSSVGALWWTPRFPA